MRCLMRTQFGSLRQMECWRPCGIVWERMFVTRSRGDHGHACVRSLQVGRFILLSSGLAICSRSLWYSEVWALGQM